MERCINIENLSKKREFPKGFTDRYPCESKIISMMTEVLPAKRPSAQQFLNRSPELQCWSFDLKMSTFSH